MKKEKEPNFFKEMDCFIKPYKKRYILSVILSMISVLCELLSYAFIGLLAGNVFNGIKDNRNIFALISAVICKIASVIFSNISTLISHKAAYLTLKDLRYVCSKKGSFPLHQTHKERAELQTPYVDNESGKENIFEMKININSKYLSLPIMDIRAIS